MSKDSIHVTENIASCSDDGQHPLVYIRLQDGKGMCQYCGQTFVSLKSATPKQEERKTGT